MSDAKIEKQIRKLLDLRATAIRLDLQESVTRAEQTLDHFEPNWRQLYCSNTHTLECKSNIGMGTLPCNCK
jgi:hypothetical protein